MAAVLGARKEIGRKTCYWEGMYGLIWLICGTGMELVGSTEWLRNMYTGETICGGARGWDM